MPSDIAIMSVRRALGLRELSVHVVAEGGGKVKELEQQVLVLFGHVPLDQSLGSLSLSFLIS